MSDKIKNGNDIIRMNGKNSINTFVAHINNTAIARIHTKIFDDNL